MKKFEAVVLDIDGTLSPEVSWYALTQGLGASAVQHKVIYDAYRNEEITYEDSKQQLIGLWQATGNANKEYMGHLFESWDFYPGVRQTVEGIQQDGYETCIITGSFDIWAKAVAERLKIKHWFANTETVWDEHGNLVDMHYEIQQGKKKLGQLETFCSGIGIKPERCLVVGDSENDIDLFIRTGHGVAVGETIDEALAQKAWKNVKTFLEVKEILGHVKTR